MDEEEGHSIKKLCSSFAESMSESKEELEFLEKFLPSDNPLTVKIIQNYKSWSMSDFDEYLKSEEEEEVEKHQKEKIPYTQIGERTENMVRCPSLIDAIITRMTMGTPEPQIETALNTLRQIPIILETIMEYLDVPSLKNLRQANKRWFTLCTNWLSKHDLLASIDFEFDVPSKTYFYKCQKYYCPTRSSLIKSFHPSGTFDSFVMDCFSKNPCHIFPCSKFGFYGGDLRCSAAHLFFSTHGPHIKQLCIEPGAEQKDTDESTLLDILLKKSPNVESLRLGNFFEINWHERNPRYFQSAIKMCMPNLKKLIGVNDGVGYCSAFDMLQIVRLPKLEIVQDFDDDYLETFETLGLVHAVKDYTFDIPYVQDADEPLSKLLQFAQAGSQLESFVITNYEGLLLERRVEAGQVVSELIESSKDTLKNLHVTPFGFFPALQLPILKNLTDLTIGDYDGQAEKKTTVHEEIDRFFPKHTNLTRVFPSLKKLTLGKWYVIKEECLEIHFPRLFLSGRFETVEELRINGEFDLPGLVWMEKLVPNLKHLSLKGPETREECDGWFLPGIRKIFGGLMKGIETFEILFRWNVPLNLDSVLTGLPVDVCERMEEKMGEDGAEMEEEKGIVKEYPGIFEMKNLKKLVLFIPNKEMEMGIEERIQFPSLVSAIYGFKQIRAFEMTIQHHLLSEENESSRAIQEMVEKFRAVGINMKMKGVPDYFQ